mgnify:FL=1
MKKLLLMVVICICVGCSNLISGTGSISGNIETVSDQNYKSMVEKYSLEHIGQKDFYEMEVAFEWSEKGELRNFQPQFITNWEEIVNSYEGESGYFPVEEKVNVDYEQNEAFYQVKFIFYAENSDEEKLKALFENEKFIVSRMGDGELAEDRFAINSLINID